MHICRLSTRTPSTLSKGLHAKPDRLARIRKVCGRGQVLRRGGPGFSTEGRATQAAQEHAFGRVLRNVAGRRQLLTVHSRRAQRPVLDLLAESGVGPAVFHGYSGPFGVLDELLEAGHYCSFDPAMTRSKKGQDIIRRVPRDRILAETDGPPPPGMRLPARLHRSLGIHATVGYRARPSDAPCGRGSCCGCRTPPCRTRCRHGSWRHRRMPTGIRGSRRP